MYGFNVLFLCLSFALSGAYSRDITREQIQIKIENSIAKNYFLDAQLKVNDNLKTLNNSYNQIEKDSDLMSVHNTLKEIIDLFAKPTSGLRDHPSYSVPILLSLAPLAANLTKRMEAAGDPEVLSCTFAATLSQYFVPFLIDRLTQIEVDIHGISRETEQYTPFKKYGKARKFTRPFQIDGLEPITELELSHCKSHNSIDEYNRMKTQSPRIIIKDHSTEDGVFISSDSPWTECVNEYLQLMRYQYELEFSNAYELVNRTCKAPLRPTGSLYLSNSNQTLIEMIGSY